MEDEAETFVVLVGHARLEDMDDLALVFVDAAVILHVHFGEHFHDGSPVNVLTAVYVDTEVAWAL